MKRTTRKKHQSQQRAGARRNKPAIAKQPQSKQQAAVQAGMFLYTNDAWSQRYFNKGDLRCMERELFG